MYKLKTSRSINKRFKMTGTGKLLKKKALRSHLLAKKSSKRKRKLRKISLVSSRDIHNFSKSLPYSN
uniref:50S ribosomal protein L35 n=1 Tax=Plumaria plumosa TaxID=189642 RepID=A0A4D6WX86_9FLOR|nr:ribosomal protein L35 [Plumaria plumosa]